jgi:hypothetical protein
MASGMAWGFTVHDGHGLQSMILPYNPAPRGVCDSCKLIILLTLINSGLLAHCVSNSRLSSGLKDQKSANLERNF